MKLRENNPFTKAKVYIYSDSTQSLDLRSITYTPASGDSIHTIEGGDTLWGLAYQFYGSSRWWWVIYKTNKLIDPINDLVKGLTIIIPDLSRFKIQNP